MWALMAGVRYTKKLSVGIRRVICVDECFFACRTCASLLVEGWKLSMAAVSLWLLQLTAAKGFRKRLLGEFELLPPSEPSADRFDCARICSFSADWLVRDMASSTAILSWVVSAEEPKLSRCGWWSWCAIRGTLTYGVVSLELSSLVALALTAKAMAERAEELLSSESSIPMPISSRASNVSAEGDEGCSLRDGFVAETRAPTAEAEFLLAERFLQ